MKKDPSSRLNPKIPAHWLTYLSTLELFTIDALLNHYDRRGREVAPSRKEIAELVGVTELGVQEAIESMISKKAIRLDRKEENGKVKTDLLFNFQAGKEVDSPRKNAPQVKEEKPKYKGEVRLPLSLRGKLKPSELAVFYVLKSYCSSSNICWPSIGKIASNAWLTKETTKEALRTLQEKGLVDVVVERGQITGADRTCYRLYPDVEL